MTFNRINEIDLLRFIAALSVVLFHYSFRGYIVGMTTLQYPIMAPIAKYGYLGVELFFMISGFVILMTASSGSLKKFVISRMVRLYPAFWVCCTLTFLTIVTIGGTRFTASVSEYLINMTMLSGFLKIPSIDGAYWSIFIELQFYALVALILLFNKLQHLQVFLILWLIATIALDTFPIGILRYILIIEYSPYFIAGAISYLIWSRGLTFSRVGMIIIAWLVALRHSLDAIPYFEKHYHTILNEFAITGIISVFFVIIFLISIRKTGFIGKKNWVTVGALTYPLYLIHQNIGFMIFNSAYLTLNPHVLFWGTFILILVIAFLVNVFFERSCSKYLKKLLNYTFDTLSNRFTTCWQRVFGCKSSNLSP